MRNFKRYEFSGTTVDIAAQLSMARKQARTDRINANQARSCLLCQADAGNEDLAPMMA